MHKAISLAVTLAVAALLIIGCSGGGANLTVPLDDGASITPEPEGGSQRFLLGVFEIDIDAAASQLTIEPVRNASAHYDVTDYITPPQCEDCLEIEVLEFKPIDHYVKLKVAIRNPTHFTVYDVRGIMISNFEGMHLLNADSYTDLWDDGGYVTINPFRAFATDWPHREILPDTGHARIYEIEYPTLGDLINALLVFDASWPGNCEEPYEIKNFVQETLYDTTTSTGKIQIDVFDWQDDISEVTLEAPEITGEPQTQFSHLNNAHWILQLTNMAGAGQGEYEARVVAKSSYSETNVLYDFVQITIDKESTSSDGWARTWGGEGYPSECGRDVVTDNFGNIYVTGVFSETVDFDPEISEDWHTSNGISDVFLAKFDSSGHFKWARTWGGTSSDKSQSVATDNSGNIYVTGCFASIVDFDPGPGEDWHTSNNDYDIFLSKFDSNGDFIWANTWGTGADYDEVGDGVATDSSGNIYVTGWYRDTIDLDPGSGEDWHISNGYETIFLSKFDSNGNYLWGRSWGGGQCWATDCGVASDSSGNIYVTGWFTTTEDFDPGPGEDLHKSNGYWDIFLSKFDSNGDFIWVRTWGGGGECDNGLEAATDNSGNIYVTGHFTKTVDFDPGNGEDWHTSNGHIDAYLSKFDSSGDFKWARTWGGEGIWDKSVGVATDTSGKVYVTGSFEETVDFNPGSGVDWHTSYAKNDPFLSKFDSRGNFLWARTWGADGGYGVATDNSGNIYVTGCFGSIVDFDPGPGEDWHIRNGFHYSDAFLIKFRPNGYW